MNRRTFLKTTASSLALTTFPSILRSDTPNANDQYTTALIGSGWWGTNILTEALAANRSKVVALCDPDPAQMDSCIAKCSLGNNPPKKYSDYRELLEKEKPQIVINATPDHWHALITIDAVKSGAHVYVEKPVSHTVLEGLAMVRAARHADRVVQVGTHRRASPHNIAARDFIRSGKLGKLGSARAFVHYGGGPEQPTPNSEPPKDMNWDTWCGPAPLRPFNSKIHPKGFRHFLDFANGQLGDWGIHWLDQILWITDRTHPATVYSTGGRSIRGKAVNDSSGQTTDAPDHQIATYSFPGDDFTAHWEHRMFAANNAEKGESVGVYFYGTEGTLHLAWQSGFTFYPADPRQPTHHMDAQLHTRDGHNIKELWADFLESIDKKRRPMCDIETGHQSTTAALLGMLSLKLDRSLHWDPTTHTIKDDPEATKLLKRDYRAPWIYPSA